MSHAVYTSEAFVLGSRGSGESSKALALLTRDFGLIYARARALRENKSKLRYALQDFSHSHVGLVRGREYWRVTGAEGKRNLYYLLRSEAPKREAIARIFILLQRILAGEEKNELLFDCVSNGIEFLSTGSLSQEDIDAVEHIVVLQVLHALGYIKEGKPFAELIENSWSRGKLQSAATHRKILISEVNRAISESQL